MNKNRLEAFSDGVLAIILTLMVLDLKTPAQPDLMHLIKLWPVYTAYMISFFHVLMMWMNHHDIFSKVEKIDSKILWFNGSFLFTSSLVPFVTQYLGEAEHRHALPAILYGLTMMSILASMFYLRHLVTQANPDLSPKQDEVNRGWISFGLFGLGSLVSFIHPVISLLIFAVTPIWRYLSSPIYHKDSGGWM